MLPMEDSYLTIRQRAQAEVKIKGSRFIAECALVCEAESALEFVETIRKREHAATHHCFAYRVGSGDRTSFKYSDDGEPSGTAGRPIYDAICGQGITNVVTVVTRYYGGTKLGTGGLVRAYTEAAKQALSRAGTQEHFITDLLHIRLDFAMYDQLLRVLNQFEASQKNSSFTDHVSLDAEVRISRTQPLIDEIIRLTGGKAVIEKVSDSEEN